MSRVQLNRGRQRSGAILFVVVACLALFLSVGIAFVFYANQQAISMRFQREAGNGGRAAYVNTQVSRAGTDEAPPQATDLFNLALGQLIYDVPDPASGSYVFSSMYGHSLARAMYGWNSTQPLNNVVPYNGWGRLPNLTVGGVNQFTSIQYAYQGSGSQRYPEWESVYPTAPSATATSGFIAKSAPYTYPDENNVYLAAVRPSDGRVLCPSFHRPWLSGGSIYQSPSNPLSMLRPNAAWQVGGTPVPNGFPPPISNNDASAIPGNTGAMSFGDVENLEGKAVHQYDSMWIDLDAPVRTWRGRLYKPLFAFLVTDLDSRININVAGNNKGPGHTSNQGFGGWEMNPNFILDPSSPQNLQTGQGTKALIGGGSVSRYRANGSNPTPIYNLAGTSVPATPSVPVAAGVPYYSVTDFDASANTNSGTNPSLVYPYATTTGGAVVPYYGVPYFPARFNVNGANGVYNEQQNHPSLYNPYFTIRTKAPKPSWAYDQSFGPEEMYFLNGKINSDPTNYAKSDLAQLATSLQTSSWAGNALNYRLAMTTISNDMQAPGLRPWLTTTGTAYKSSGSIIPLSEPLPSGTAQTTPTAPSNPSGTGSEFDANWRSIFGNNNYLTPSVINAQALGACDLNRKLTDYRGNPSLPFDAIVSPTAPYALIPSGSTGGVPNGSINYAQATLDRQALASDIFNRLMAATGLKVPGQTFAGNPLPSTTVGAATYSCYRFLAQIAVNIVDYIDNDDYITPFNWNPAYGTYTTGAPPTPNFSAANPIVNGWVFGTELPRLVINETLQVIDNDYVNGVAPSPPTNTSKATGNYLCGLWIELFNPLTPPGGSDPNLSHGGGAPLVYPPPGTTTTSQTTQPVYQLIVANALSVNIMDNSNPDGSPDSTPVNPNTANSGFTAGATASACFVVSPLASTTVASPALNNGAVPPSNATQGLPLPTATNPQAGNPGFYVIGPPNAYNLYYNSPAGGNAGQPATIPGTTAGASPATTPGVPVSYSPPVGTNGFSPLMWPLANSTTFSTLGGAANRAIAEQVLLQRLIHPHLKPNGLTAAGNALQNPALPYNPYVTTDYYTVNNFYSGTLAALILDHRYLTPTGVNTAQFSFSNQCSFGRDQPYDNPSSIPQSFNDAKAAKSPQPFPDTTALNHTFYQQDATATTVGIPLTSFTWVPHLDRPLNSLPELFWVSAWPPYYYTYLCCQNTKTVVVNGQSQIFPIGHTVPWFVNDSSTSTSTATFTYPAGTVNPLLLYRALGLLDVRNKMQGIPFGGGRVPGKVNINTIWDPPSLTNLAGASVASPTLNAMCDPPGTVANPNPASTANLFAQQNVINAWWGLCNNTGITLSRMMMMGCPSFTQTQVNGNYYPVWNPGVIGPPTALYDMPFMPASSGFTASTDPQNPPLTFTRGVQNTILGLGAYTPTADATTGSGIFMNTTEAHPYLQMEMLNKFYNNYTTRSNTFAVYCTIGYFEVTNTGPFGPTNRPVLGKEIGSDDGNNIRHKFFAVVDRTNLAIDAASTTSQVLQGMQPVYMSYEPTTTDVRLPDPNASTLNAVSVRIPATGTTTVNGAAALTGIYDGQTWTLQVGATILLDMGDRQELAYVQSLTSTASGAVSAPTPGVGADITIGATSAAGAQKFKYAHYRGANMQMNYAQTMPGNPGPQPLFNFKDSRYRAVVPFVTRFN